MESVFGVDNKQSIELNIYADEIKKFRNPQGVHWLYIGILAIPVNKQEEILCSLLSDREEIDYYNPLHFSEITRHKKYRLAEKWLNRIKYDIWKDPIPSEGSKGYFFHLLGVNLSNLQHSVFGDSGSEHFQNIYNRFFRSTLLYLLKSCFPNHSEIIVNNLYHHAGYMENNDIFDWHAIWRLENRESNIKFQDEEIEFVECNKQNPGPREITEFIQIIDLLLGSIRQCYDFTSKKRWMIKTAQVIRPLFASISDKFRYRERSKFGIANRGYISFFPSKKLSVDELEDIHLKNQSNFYNNRKINLPPGSGDYQQLDFFQSLS